MTQSQDQADHILGIFLRIWGQVELQQFLLFQKLLDSPGSTAVIVYYHINRNETSRDIIGALAQVRLGPKQRKEIEILMNKLKTLTAKRNKIIHGHWMMLINKSSKNEKDHTAELVRAYMPGDVTLLEKMFGPKASQKEKSKFIYHLNRLMDTTHEADSLAKGIEKIIGELILLPPEIPSYVQFEK